MLRNFSKFETMLFVFCFVVILALSIFAHDSILSILAALFGITYTIFAGKGRFLCFIFGVLSIVLYAFLAFQKGLWGNFCLYIFYYLPMSFIGFINWKNNLKKDGIEIVKTYLPYKKKLLCFLAAVSFSLFAAFILYKAQSSNPLLDGIVTVFSIAGMYLTSKRLIEQWFFWFVADFAALLMWLFVCFEGDTCLALIFSRGIYCFLALYFWLIWQKEVFNAKIG